MDLNFTVRNQEVISMNTRKIASRSANYLKAIFNFSEDWDGLFKTVVFLAKNERVKREVLLTNDECFIPEIILNFEGEILVGVYGVSGDKRITTAFKKIRVKRGAYGIPLSGENGEIYKDELDEIEDRVSFIEHSLNDLGLDFYFEDVTEG